MDIFPDAGGPIAGVPQEARLQPQDGIDLLPVLDGMAQRRDKSIGFRHTGRVALIDNNLKIVRNDENAKAYQLYDLGGRSA